MFNTKSLKRIPKIPIDPTEIHQLSKKCGYSPI